MSGSLPPAARILTVQTGELAEGPLELVIATKRTSERAFSGDDGDDVPSDRNREPAVSMTSESGMSAVMTREETGLEAGGGYSDDPSVDQNLVATNAAADVVGNDENGGEFIVDDDCRSAYACSADDLGMEPGPRTNDILQHPTSAPVESVESVEPVKPMESLESRKNRELRTNVTATHTGNGLELAENAILDERLERRRRANTLVAEDVGDG